MPGYEPPKHDSEQVTQLHRDPPSSRGLQKVVGGLRMPLRLAREQYDDLHAPLRARGSLNWKC